MSSLPKNIADLLDKREDFRRNQNFAEADKIRVQIEALGFIVQDNPDGISTALEVKQEITLPHKVAVLGSWDKESIGRIVHEELIKNFQPPVKIALIETPAGFEDNPGAHYNRLKKQLESSLANYKADISLIEAFSRQAENGTNSQEVANSLRDFDCLHIGAGSPSYAVKNLKETQVYKVICEQVLDGYPLSLASASAIALSQYALPVYEIFKVGEELHWIEGLNFFKAFGLSLTFVPHWNNQEGGEEIDTSRCYIGQRRFSKLVEVLPQDTTLIGIDEHTAIIFDLQNKRAEIVGKGQVYIPGKSISFTAGSRLNFAEL